MDYKIDAKYEANVLFEVSVAVKGQSYLVIYGKHINGYFCYISDYHLGCEMSEPNDILYNTNSLTDCGIQKDIAEALAKAIQECAKNKN